MKEKRTDTNMKAAMQYQNKTPADIAWGELKNAKTRLEYAIWEGGTLYVVEDARRMLSELTQKERMEGADYGDGTVKI